MNAKHFGPTQLAILKNVAGGRWFLADQKKFYAAALVLNGLGFLARDPHSSRLFTSTAKTDQIFAAAA